MNKRDELTQRVKDYDPDIIQLTETLPKRKTDVINQELEFSIPGYCKPLVNENPSRGIAVLVKENIDVKVNDKLSNLHYSESLFCSLKINDISVLLGCVYRSGSEDKYHSTNELIELLKQTENMK